MVFFFSPLVAPLIIFSLSVGLASWLLFRRGWRLIISRSSNIPLIRAGRPADSSVTDQEIKSSPTTADCFPVRVRSFDGDSRMFKEWCFSVELALRSHNINYGRREVELASSLLEGNELLWLIACQEAGTIFNNWIDFRNALARTFGPLQSEEEHRLSLFSLRQVGSLEEYIQDFTRPSLSVAGLDEHSRAVLFVKGLQSDLQADALREHLRHLSDALVAARMARRQLSFLDHDQQSWKSSEVASRTSLPRKSDLTTLRVAPSAKVQQQPSISRPTKLTDELRRKLMREGRCFKCRQFGHLSKDCPDHSHPNDKRQ